MLESVIPVKTGLSKCYSLATQQNAFLLMRSIFLEYPYDETVNVSDSSEGCPTKTLRDIKLKLSSSPAIFSDVIWEIGQFLEGKKICPYSKGLWILVLIFLMV